MGLPQWKRGCGRNEVMFGISLLLICGTTLWTSIRMESNGHNIAAVMEERSILPPNDTKNNDFDVAKRESLGFFNDVPSQTWNRLRKKVKDMSPNYNPVYLPFKKTGNHHAYKPGSFYQNNYEPDFVCQHELRIGRYVKSWYIEHHLDVCYE